MNAKKMPVAPALALAWLLLAAPAQAALQCGDTITSDKTLKSDLDCSATAGSGLTIGADGVTLDLDGNQIRGDILAVGVLSNGFDNTTVKNGEIRDFQVGIEMENGTGLTVKDMVTRSGLDHGIEVVAADDVKVSGSEARSTENLAGIRVGDSTGVELTDNDVVGGDGNGFGLNDSDLLTVTGNSASESGLDGFFVNNVTGSLIEDNSAVDGDGYGVNILGASEANVVNANEVKRSAGPGIKLSANDGPNRITANEVTRAGDRGIIIDLGALSVLVRKNTVERANGDGMELNEASTVIRGNTANDNGDYGIDSASAIGSHNKASGNGGAAQCFPASLCA